MSARALGWSAKQKSSLFSVDLLVVGGGGGGGGASSFPLGPYSASAGGGGAGGYLASQTTVSINSFYPIKVGAGGSGGSAGQPGSNGSSSEFNGIICPGGGFGGRANSVTNISGGGGAGASGGGGGASFNGSSYLSAGGLGMVGVGYNGGDGGLYGPTAIAGGAGGGAGGVGSPGSTANGWPPGGSGLPWPFDSIVYAAGGPATKAGSGGPGQNAAANTGKGGGGASTTSPNVEYAGGNGGPGIVKLRIPNSYTAIFSPGVVQTSAPSGTYIIYSITAAAPTSTVTFT